MTISTSTIQLVESGSAIYMLHWGDYDYSTSQGPYLGKAGLDFEALAEECRLALYAAAESELKDQCTVHESDFVSWLVSNGTLTPIKTTDARIEVRTSFGKAYVPKHWPECPECREGRGEPDYGRVRKSLNRIESLHRCTECRHAWGHHEIPNIASQPMLDDDGRDTPGACVPYAISKACSLEFSQVLAVCDKHGWSEAGMNPRNALVAARELGYDLVWRGLHGVGTEKPPTLKQLLTRLPGGRNFVIGVKNHWLALVDGQMVDNDNDTGLGCKVVELYEARSVKAIAA